MTIILRKELKRNFRAWIGWTLAVVATVGLMMALYPMVADNAAKIDELLTAYPKGMLAAVGLDKLKMSDVMGFYGSETYTFMLLIGTIYAAMFAGGIIAKEESDKTVSFLLAKPVTRNQVVTAKALTVAIYLVLLNIVQFVTAWVSIELVKRGNYNLKAVVLLAVAAFVIECLFAGIGLLISVFIPKLKSLLQISMGVVMSFYFLNLMIKLAGKLDFLLPFSPFNYADGGTIITEGALNGLDMAIAAIVTAVTVAATYYFYGKKDITA